MLLMLTFQGMCGWRLTRCVKWPDEGLDAQRHTLKGSTALVKTLIKQLQPTDTAVLHVEQLCSAPSYPPGCTLSQICLLLAEQDRCSAVSRVTWGQSASQAEARGDYPRDIAHCNEGKASDGACFVQVIEICSPGSSHCWWLDATA